MVALYVTSLEKGSGKTAVCAGLGKYLLTEGKKIGFFKPVITDGKKTLTAVTDSDAEFIKHLFSLDESVDLLCPILSGGSNLTSGIKEAYAKVSQGKDVVIIEGPSEQHQASRDIIKVLNGKVLIVETYPKELLKTIERYKNFEESLLGVVLNKVPKSRMEQARSEASAWLDKSGINILGVIPEDRTLFALTIGELAERIQGEILCGAEKSAELVESILLGGMVVDPGPDYFGRKDNKVVVLKSERPDMQMAAMETSTRCLVLTRDTPLKPVVLDRAEEKKISIIIAKGDVTSIISNIEDAFGKVKFNQENKLPKLTEIMGQHFAFQTVYKGLGLAG
ncbi:AAA family ATPase [Chloroflexota bacterium]